MTDRMDIDALLIGALYGELTPADEARLAAHLESHPADRTALADLTHTRAAVRESRILAVQLDPPQSVSALLLQEAARRAPRPPRETSSWFHRIARSFMAHPALAAAATCVVVVGVAGTLYVRHGTKLAADSAAERAVVAAAPSYEAKADPTRSPATAPTPAPAVAAPTPPPAAEPTGATRGEGAGVDKEVAAGGDADAFRVGLDDVAAEQAQRRTAGRAKDSDRPTTLAEGKRPAPDTVDSRFSNADVVEDAEDAELQKAQRRQKKTKGIELRSPEPQPKELDDRARRADVAGAREGGAGGKVAADDLAQAPAGAPPSRAAAGVKPPDPAANEASPSPSKPAVAKGPGKADASKSESAPKQSIAAGPSAQAPAAPPATTGKASERNQGRLADQAAAPADGKLVEEKDRANDPVLGWAEKQRDQVIALVKSNKCRAAASAAVEIYNRAPDYYTANVATAREVKPCVQYLNNERQREDNARAVKRANAVDTAPSQAAPPVKK
jgi:hypothetical protein